MEKIVIGERIKSLRKQKNLTLEKLSTLTGIQIATLSRMENNKMTGTVQAHAKIANIFQIDINELYRGLKTKKDEVDLADKPEVITKKQSTSRLLVNNASTKKMIPINISISPNGKTSTQMFNVNTEGFIYVLKGKINASIYKEAYELEQDHSIHFNASRPHYFENPTTNKAEILYIRTQ